MFLLAIVIFLVVPVYSFEISEIEKSWREKGYTVLEEDNLKIVELSFQFDNILSLNEPSQELFIITYLDQNISKPDGSYISDIEKVFANSSFSVDIIKVISNQLNNQNTWENTFFVTDSIQIDSMLYDQTTPIVKVSFEENKMPSQVPSESESNEVSIISAEQLEQLNAEYIKLDLENTKLRLEVEIHSNKNAVLEKTNQDLKENLEKFKNLSVYKDNTISGLKSTIDRYVSIEKQKNETIDNLQMRLEMLEEEYAQKEIEYKKALNDLESEKETLEMKIKRQALEIKMIKETEQGLLNRVEQLKTINENQIVQIQTKSEIVDTPKATKNPTIASITHQKPVTTDVSTKVNTEDEQQDEKNILEIQSPEETSEQIEKQKPPLLEKVVVYDKGGKTVTIENEYNDKGDLIKEHFISPEGKTLMITEIKYSSNGQVKERVNYENSQVVGKNLFQYDDQKRLVRVFTYNQETLIYYTVLEYDKAFSDSHPVKVKYFRNNQLDYYEENDFSQDGKLIKTVQKNPDGKIISSKEYEYTNDNIQKIIYYQFGDKTSYQINIYDKNGLQKTQKTYDAEDQMVSEMKFIWDEAE